MLQKMKELVKEQDICVLATVSAGRPHCSLMAYVTDEDCREIYMVSLRGTKKFQNLRQNPAVSLLIDTREKDERSRAKALTVGGRFQQVERERKERVHSRLLKRHPHLRELMGKEEAEIFAVQIETLQLLEGAIESHFERLSGSSGDGENPSRAEER